jgi:hypothetical protein
MFTYLCEWFPNCDSCTPLYIPEYINKFYGKEFLMVYTLCAIILQLFGLKREEVAGGWRRLHIEELHNLYASPNVIKVIKSGKVDGQGM